MSEEWRGEDEGSEEDSEEGEPGSPSSYFQSESSKVGDQKSSEGSRSRKTMTVEVEVHCRRKRWARPPVVGGGSGSESEEPRVSPSSSVASLRPLEWDSGADVGYSCYPPGEGEEGVRREPEGRTRETDSKIAAPTAESTPKVLPPPLFPEARNVSPPAGEDHPPPQIVPVVRPSNSSSSINTVVTNSEQHTLSRHQELGARSESVEWVSVEGEAERGAELLGKLVEGREPTLAKAIISRVFARLLHPSPPPPPGLDKCTGTGRSLVNDTVDSSTSTNNTKPSIEGESMATDTSSEKRPYSSSSISVKTNDGGDGKRWERRAEWRKPATATERMRERQDTSSESVDDKKLTEMVNSERKTQLEWIKSEISHLSSLQKLLEQHEQLKENVIKLKRQNKNRRVTPILKPEPTSQQESGWSSHNYCETDSSTNQVKRPKGKTEGGERARVVGLSRQLTNFTAQTRAAMNKGTSTVCGKSSAIGVQTSPRPVSYEISFVPKDPRPKVSPKKETRLISLEELHAALDQILKPASLQEELLLRRPEVVRRAEERRQVVRELVRMREERAAMKREILIRGGRHETLPPPPLAVKKAVSTAERRKRRFQKDNSKEEAKKKEEAHRTNRFMAQMFNRKLQARTLKGEVDLSNSTSVISSI